MTSAKRPSSRAVWTWPPPTVLTASGPISAAGTSEPVSSASVIVASAPASATSPTAATSQLDSPTASRPSRTGGANGRPMPYAIASSTSSGTIENAEPAHHAREYLEGQEIEAGRELGDVVAQPGEIGGRDPSAVTYQGVVGEPGDAIVELAQERGADLIVLGTRELSALARLLGQSVSDSDAQ